MIRGWAIAVVVAGLAGCGGGGESKSAVTPTPQSDSAGTPNRIDIDAPPGTERGRRVAAQSGCLACHVIGDEGNNGPGPELTHVGARLTAQQIARQLVDPEPPMPSFKALPKTDRAALVKFLSALK